MKTLNTVKIINVLVVIDLLLLTVGLGNTTSFVLLLLSLAVLFMAYCIHMEEQEKYDVITTVTNEIDESEVPVEILAFMKSRQ